MKKKAILVVSFGSSYEETRRKTIDKIEKEIKNSFPYHSVYRAFTSPRIRKILSRQQQSVWSVSEALQQMKQDKIEEVIVQPTFIITGKEYEKMCQVIQRYKDAFEEVTIGHPLLGRMEDYFRVAEIFYESLGTIKEDEAVLCMGHGTEQLMSVSYAALDYVFKERVHPSIYMATIESYPGLEQVIRLLKKKTYTKVRIVPFMLVAGHHAYKDIKGSHEKSWENQLINAGYQVECVLRGLGELPKIRQLFIEHIQNCMKK